MTRVMRVLCRGFLTQGFTLGTLAAIAQHSWRMPLLASQPVVLRRHSSLMTHKLSGNEGSEILPHLRCYHVLVRTGQHNSGLLQAVFLPPLHRCRQTQMILLWAESRVLSLRAVYITVHANLEGKIHDAKKGHLQTGNSLITHMSSFVLEESANMLLRFG